MSQTVDAVADHITDIFIEKMADGFVDNLKGLGQKAMGGLSTAKNYMLNKATPGGPSTLHGALGGNDALHWGALGALGAGGLGAVKGLIAPDDGKGRVNSMISNAALGALMGGAGGATAGMTFPGVENPTLGGGSIFGGNREKLNNLQGNLNRANADLDVNRARAVLGPVGAATAAIGNAPQTGWGSAAMTAGSELAKPIQESTNNLTQSGGAALGAHAARRAWQHRRLDNLTTGDTKITGRPWFSKPDIMGHLGGTTEAIRTIDAGTLQDAANRASAAAKAPPPVSAGVPFPKGTNTVNTGNMPPPVGGAAASGSHDIQKVIEELKDVISGPSIKGDKENLVPSRLPPGFHESQYQDLVKTHGNTGPNRAALQEAINSGKDYKFKTRVPLGGTWRGVALSQAGGQLAASQLRNLPESIRRIRELDSSAWGRPEQLIPGVGAGTPGETQLAEQALQKFLAEQAARGGK